jgi:hypothetical protein
LVVNNDELISLVASLVRERNAIDAKLAQIMHRPMASGHLGEWLASQIFDIELEKSAVTRGWDGRFRSGPLHDRTVNIKWYLKREGMLDTVQSTTLDCYLVLAGPASAAISSRGGTRPWCINSVYLFSAPQLHAEQVTRNVKLGVASSVRAQQWTNAEIYPSTNPLLPMTPRQIELLGQFRSE